MSDPNFSGDHPIGDRVYAVFAVFGTATGTAVALYEAIVDGGVVLHVLISAVVLLVATGIGLSLGLHRLFSHSAFVAKRPLRVLLAVLGIAAGQGFFFRWVQDHQLHHRFTDKPGDPHSPHWYGTQPLFGVEGFLHAHFLWLFRTRPAVVHRYVRGLGEDPLMVSLDRFSPWIVAAGIVLPGLVAFSVQATLSSFLSGCLWGGFVRMFLMNQITWSVNSYCHGGGVSHAGSSCRARNSGWLGVLAFGDGWHANHHAHPTWSRHGLSWFEFDMNWQIIRLCRCLGWVSSIRGATRE